MLPLIRNLEEERDKSGTRCHRTGKSQTYRLSVFWLIVKAESVPIDWMHGYHCGGDDSVWHARAKGLQNNGLSRRISNMI